MENEHRHITSVILNLKSWKFVRNMMINNIKLKLIKLLSFKNIGKGLISIALITSMLTSPFLVHANGNLSAPFVGYNVYVYSIENEYWVQTQTVDIDISNLRLNCQSVGSSGVCSIYSQTSNNNADVTGNIYSSVSSNVATLYRVDLILDDDYIGSVSLNYGGTNQTFYVNGNVISFTFGSNTSLSINSYNLIRKNNSNLYSFPIESSNFISSMDMYGYYPSGFNTINYGTFPVYDLKTNNEFVKSAVNPANPMANDYIVIFGISDNIYNATSFNNAIGSSAYETTYAVEYIETLYRNSFAPFSIVKCHIYPTSNQVVSVALYLKNNYKFMPVYANYSSYTNLSTDFALQMKLNNPVIESLNVLTQGNQESIDTSNNLDDTSEALANQVQNLNNVNESLENDMSSSLTNLDTNSLLMQSQQFTNGMSWLKARFNTMFTNNPFGWYIQISLIIGIAIFMIGRYRK